MKTVYNLRAGDGLGESLTPKAPGQLFGKSGDKKNRVELMQFSQ